MDRSAPFDCLWCGTRYLAGSPDDLEAWARLCPACLGRAGENRFLRFRLREAVAARGRASAPRGEADAAAPIDGETSPGGG